VTDPFPLADRPDLVCWIDGVPVLSVFAISYLTGVPVDEIRAEYSRQAAGDFPTYFDWPKHWERGGKEIGARMHALGVRDQFEALALLAAEREVPPPR
jgi:hypothetical protein